MPVAVTEDVRRTSDVLFVTLPSPPGRDVMRYLAGGFGLSVPNDRAGYGHGGGTVMPHLAMVYAFSSALEAGMDASFLDAQAEDLDVEPLRERVRQSGPRVIVASISLPTMPEDLSLLRRLKEDTHAAVVSVGTTARILTEEVMADGVVDVAVSGDIEAVGVDLLQRMLQGQPLDDQPGVAVRRSGSIVAVPGGLLTSLDGLPMPAYEHLPLQRYRNWEFGRSKRFLGKQYGEWAVTFPLYLSRGCPFVCPYCPYPVGHGKRHMVKDTDQALEEFRLLAQHGVTNVALRDQVLPVEHGALERFCTGLKKLDLGMTWMCEARVGSLSDSLLRLMRQAGCFRVHYGVETGDPTVFRSEAKRGIGPAAVGPCFDATRAAGMEPEAHFLIGFKDDDWTSIGRTIALIDELHIGIGDCSVLTAYPGTQGYEEMLAEGRLVTDDWHDFTGSSPVAGTDHLTPVEILVGRALVFQALARNLKPGLRRQFEAVRKALKEPGTVEFDTARFVAPFVNEHISRETSAREAESGVVA